MQWDLLTVLCAVCRVLQLVEIELTDLDRRFTA
jgi:hypothetical protein